MELSDIKTIDVTAKEWFDKVNGNSYFSGRITLNYGMDNEETIIMPFQYGYGNHYEWKAMEAMYGYFGLMRYDMAKAGPISLWCRKNGIILRSSKIENCKKRELKDFVSS